MKHGLSLFLSFSLIGCGGGTVSLNQQKVRQDKYAEKWVSALVATDSQAERKAILVQLQTELGDPVQWSVFWKSLKDSSLSQNSEFSSLSELHNLQARSCAEADFNEYVSYLASSKVGFENLFTAKRVCQTAVRPDLAILVSESFYNEADKVNSDSEKRMQVAIQIATFIQTELQRHSSSAWTAELGKSFSFVRKIVLELISTRQFASAFQFADSVRKTEGRYPGIERWPAILSGEAGGEGFIASLQKVLGTHKTLELVYSLVETDPKAFQVTDTRAPLLSSIANLPSDPKENPNMVWAQYRKTSQLFRLLTEMLSFSEKLRTQEILRLSALERTRTILNLDDERSQLFQLIQGSSHLETSLDFTWLICDLLTEPSSGLSPVAAETTKIFLETYLKDLLQAKEDALSSIEHPVERATYLIVKMLWSSSIYQKSPNPEIEHKLKQSVDSLCSLYESQDLTKKPVASVLDSSGSLISPFGPGCYEHTGSDPLRIHVKTDSTPASGYSVLRTLGANLEIRSPRTLRLPVLDLSNPKQHPDLPQAAVAPGSQAIAVPIILGFVLEQPGPKAWKGTHFLTIHTLLEPAKAGVSDTRTPAQGFQGGNFIWNSPEPTFLPVFVSQGGPGQRPAPETPGGDGDLSRVSVSAIQSVLDAFATSTNQEILSPFDLDAAPKKSATQEILSRAKRDSQNNIKVIIAPELIASLDAIQLGKLEKWCAMKFPDQAPENRLQNCILSSAVELALNQLREVLEDSTTSGDSIPAITNATLPRAFPGGPLGPKNAPGLQGTSGKVSLLKEP